MRRALPLCLGLISAFGATACGGSSPQSAGRPAHSVPVAASTARPVELPPCIPVTSSTVPAELWKKRSEALAALLGGEPERAANRFEKVLLDRPTDVGSAALAGAAKQKIAVLREEQMAAYDRVKPLTVGMLPASAVVNQPLVLPGSHGTAPHLTLVSKGGGPEDDLGFWLDAHGLDDFRALDGNNSVRGMVAGVPWTESIRFPDHRIEVFGPQLFAVTGVSARAKVFDFRPKSSVRHAQVVGDALIVLVEPESENGVQTGGFVAALDLATGNARWRSEDRSALSANFALSGNYLFAGSETEKDGGEVTAIDLRDGKVVDRLTVGFDAEDLYFVGNQLLVKGNAGDAVLSIGVPVDPPPIALGSSPPRKEAVDARSQCILERALAALDDRDGARAEQELKALDRTQLDRGPATALQSAAGFLVRSAAKDPDVIDFTAFPVIKLAPRPTGKLRGQPAKIASAPRFTKHSSPTPAAPTPTQVTQLVRHPRPQEAFIGLPPAVGMSSYEPYGAYPFHSANGYPAGNIEVFGERYIATLNVNKPTAVYDAAAITSPAGKSHTYADPGLVEAALTNDLIVLETTPARPSPASMEEVVTAFDRKTGAVAWQSDPHVASGGFLLHGDYLISFVTAKPKEKAAILVLRLDTGETVNRITLTDSPTEIGWSNKEFAVRYPADRMETYDVAY